LSSRALVQQWGKGQELSPNPFNDLCILHTAVIAQTNSWSKTKLTRLMFRGLLSRKKGVEEKKMFGCVCFLIHGNMLVGVWKDSLIARLGPDEGEAALREPHVRDFDITGRAMKGWVLVGPDGIEGDDQLAGWIERAVKFVGAPPLGGWRAGPSSAACSGSGFGSSGGVSCTPATTEPRCRPGCAWRRTSRSRRSTGLPAT
jgi:hypothetical protein